MQQVAFDLDGLRIISGGNAEIERQWVRLYMSTAERCLGMLRQALNKEKEWAAAAHELHSMSSNIYADQLAALCRQAEAIGNDSVARQQLYHDICREYEALLPVLKQVVERR